MDRRARAVLSSAAVALAAALAFGGDGHDGQLPKTPAEALEWATPLIDAAVKAKSAETPEIAKGIRRAVDWMQPHLKKGSAEADWAKTWNLSLSLSRFHGNKPGGAYVLDPQRAHGNYVAFGLPRGRNWSFEPSSGDQHGGNVLRTTGDGRPAASVTLYAYWFTTVYSGIGGENTAKLAERQFQTACGEVSKIESKSTQVAARALNKSLGRAWYFELLGTMDKYGRVRQRTYYVKGSTRTFAFNAYQYLDTLPTDSPFEAWQKGVEDPELDAVLDSIELTDPSKVK